MNYFSKHLLLIATFLMATTDLSLSNQATEPSVKPSVLAKISKISTRSKVATAAISAIVLTALAGYVGLKRENSCLADVHDDFIVTFNQEKGWVDALVNNNTEHCYSPHLLLSQSNKMRWALDLIAKKCSGFAKTLPKDSEAKKAVQRVAYQARKMCNKFHRTSCSSEEFYYDNIESQKNNNLLFDRNFRKLLKLHTQARNACKELAKSSADLKIKDLNEISGIEFQGNLNSAGELEFNENDGFNITFKRGIFDINGFFYRII